MVNLLDAICLQHWFGVDCVIHGEESGDTEKVYGAGLNLRSLWDCAEAPVIHLCCAWIRTFDPIDWRFGCGSAHAGFSERKVG